MLLRAIAVFLLALGLATPVHAADSFIIGVMNDESGPYADLAGPGSVEIARMVVEDFDSKYPWDCLAVVAKIPAAKAFRPPGAGGCARATQ
jgi:hypothetical protein